VYVDSVPGSHLGDVWIDWSLDGFNKISHFHSILEQIYTHDLPPDPAGRRSDSIPQGRNQRLGEYSPPQAVGFSCQELHKEGEG
jgi:hypothetical protein